LKDVLGDHSASIDAAFSEMNCRNWMQKLQHRICQLVEVISFSNVPVVFTMDDVQWPDAASLSVLQSLLRHGKKRFLFVGCCRDGETESDHLLWKMTKEASAAGICLTTVELNGIDEYALNGMISELLCLSRRLVKPLTEKVFRKTRGNPLFMHHLLLSLNRNGLLHVDLGRKRFVWNCSKILSYGVSVCFIEPVPFALCCTHI
jgi:predicted ATPase